MNAFLGILHLDDASAADAETLGPLVNRIRYRGTSTEIWKDEKKLTLASVVDQIATDARPEVQPFVLGEQVIVTDALLANRLELTEALAKQTEQPVHELRMMPDSELMLRAYRVWGDDCPAHFLGKFSLAIWDGARNHLLLAIDPLGQGALLFAQVGNTLVFSTEFAVLRYHPLVGDALDLDSVAKFLSLGSFRHHDLTRTIFAKIQRLAPAHRISLDCGDQQLRPVIQTQYWTLPTEHTMLRYPKLSDYANHFRQLLTDVVRGHVRSDRIVVAMSGGMDSTSLAAILSLLQKQEGLPAHLNVVHASYNRVHNDNSESYYATLVANILDIPIHYIQADPFKIVDPLPALAEPAIAYQNGLLDHTQNEWLKHGKLLYTGDGPDEMFFQTPLLQIFRRMPAGQAVALYRWLWKLKGRHPELGLRTAFSDMLRKVNPPKKSVGFDPKDNIPQWINPDFAAQVHLQEIWDHYWNTPSTTSLHPIHPDAYSYLTDASWNHNIEMVHEFPYTPPSRISPFLDARLIEFAMSLPPQLSTQPKYVLRQAMQGLLPPEVLKRRKEPLGMMLSSLLRQPGAEWVDHWTPIPELGNFVRRDAIPPIVMKNPDWGTRYLQEIHLRPLLLNTWLKAVRSDTVR